MAAKKRAQRREINLDEMEITDDFMFGTVFRDVDLCRELVETLLGIELESAELVERQEHLDAGPLSRAGIVDIMVRDTAGNVFDVEMQNYKEDDIAFRARRYLSLMDLITLDRGKEFGEARGAVVVFICTYDPFDRGWKRYNFPRASTQDGMPLGDLTDVVFVNVQGSRGEYGAKFDAFLDYLRDHNNVESDYVRKVDNAVRQWRNDPMWRRNRVLWSEKYRNDYARATREGREEGREEGRVEGARRERESLSQLAECLEAAGRSDELLPALRDSSRLDQLMKEFGIQP